MYIHPHNLAAFDLVHGKKMELSITLTSHSESDVPVITYNFMFVLIWFSEGDVPVIMYNGMFGLIWFTVRNGLGLARVTYQLSCITVCLV